MVIGVVLELYFLFLKHLWVIRNRLSFTVFYEFEAEKLVIFQKKKSIQVVYIKLFLVL